MDKERQTRLKEIVMDEMEKALYLLNNSIDQENTTTIIENKLLELLKDLVEKQRDNIINQVGNIVFMESLVNIINLDYNYPVMVYGERIYIDEYQLGYSLDVSFIYKSLEDLKNKCISRAKKFVNYNISICEIEAEIINYIEYYNMFIVKILRDIFKKENVLSLINKLDKTNDFMIILSLIYERPYVLFSF